MKYDLQDRQENLREFARVTFTSLYEFYRTLCEKETRDALTPCEIRTLEKGLENIQNKVRDMKTELTHVCDRSGQSYFESISLS